MISFWFQLISAVGFCDAEMTVFPLNTYFWPEVEVGTTASLPCGLGPLTPNGMARRTCNPNTTEWDPVSLDECFTSELFEYKTNRHQHKL